MNGVSKYTTIERFMIKIRPESASGCWNWTGALSPAGYGVFGGKEYGENAAHRLAYRLLVGPIPKGLHIDHLCRNRRCCNPDHLEAVTHAENVRRGLAGINHRDKTHCANGHPFSDENTFYYVQPNGKRWRRCRACIRMSALSRRVPVRAMLVPYVLNLMMDGQERALVDIARALPEFKSANVKNTVRHLFKRGDLLRIRHGVYVAAGEFISREGATSRLEVAA